MTTMQRLLAQGCKARLVAPHQPSAQHQASSMCRSCLLRRSRQFASRAYAADAGASTATSGQAASKAQGQGDAQQAKRDLFDAIARSNSNNRKAGRGEVEECQVALEAFGEDIDYDKLQGLWRLQYTTASDVAPLMAGMQTPSWVPTSLPFPRIGAVYQRFTSVDEGIVQNIIQGGAGLFLAQGNGVTFTVNAKFAPSGPKTVKLMFQSAQVGDLRITDGLEALIAPSVLPRTTLQQQILLGAKELALCVPLPTPSNISAGNSYAVGRYMLSYLDDDTLLGRAQAGSGVFIFKKVDDGDLDAPK